MSKKYSLQQLESQAAHSRNSIREHRTVIRRCDIRRHAAYGITPAVVALGFLNDPITAAIAGILGVALTIVVRAWLLEVIRRREYWIRRDRATLHEKMARVREKRATVATHQALQQASRKAQQDRERRRQQQVQKAAQKRFEQRRQSECRDKFQHATEESAVRHMEKLTAREGKRLSVYQCEFCTHWHVGNSSRGVALVHRPFAKLKEVTS